MTTDPLVLYGQSFASRLLLGTARYPSPAVLQAAVQRARPAMVTASLRRQGINATNAGNSFWELLKSLAVPVLPNTAGCHSVQEAVTTAQMAREVFDTPWIKLEVIGDPKSLYPDNEETLEAARILVKEGFIVLPYVNADPILAKKLADAGCAAVMPLGSAIGSGLGVQNPYTLLLIREVLQPYGLPMVVDAGVGTASDAALAMELGADAVLLNTAVAESPKPERMAQAMRDAVRAGRLAWEAGRMPKRLYASASSPVEGVVGR